MTMATERLESLEQVRAFVEGSEGLDFAAADRSSRNDFVRRMLVRFDYTALDKADKGLMKRFPGKATGLSRAQLEGLLGLFPFVIKGFHADNGSEYVNHKVAALLEKLRAEFTRSRPRRCNDNAPRSSRGQARSRARTRASCAATSGANTSPRVSPRRSTSSPAPCCPHT